MQFRIIGTERDTGQGVAKIVRASSREDAESIARDMNVEVQKIHFISSQDQSLKTAKPKKGRGVWIFVGIVALLIILGMFTGDSGQSTSRWYLGGTLHKATIADWNSATYRNRLATCADFVAKLQQVEGKQVTIDNFLRAEAFGLERCITEAGRGGYADNMRVTEVAATCRVLMND